MGDVTQSAREAAWQFRPEGYGPIDQAAWFEGHYDGNRHIQAITQAEARGRIAGLREAAAVVDRMDADANMARLAYGRPQRMTGAVSAAITALIPGEPK